MSSEDRLSRAEEIIANLAVIARDASKRLGAVETAVSNIDERLDKLVELAQSFDERLDTLAEAQANSEQKIAALADAQIRTEEAMAKLSDRMAELAAQRTHSDQRLDALIDIVRETRDGRRPEDKQ